MGDGNGVLVDEPPEFVLDVPFLVVKRYLKNLDMMA